MPKVIKKRVSKTARSEEGVKDILLSTREFVSEKQKTILPVVIALVVLSLAGAGFFMYRAEAKNKAIALEYEGYKLYYGLYQKQPLQKEEQYRKALEKFKNAYEMRKSPVSLFYMASCYYDMGKDEEAMKALKELNERFPDDERFVPLVYYKMAVINIKKGDRDTALNLLDTIYHYKTGAFKDLALVESARILESMGKTAESAKKYEEITKNFPESPFLEEAKTKLGGKKG